MKKRSTLLWVALLSICVACSGGGGGGGKKKAAIAPFNSQGQPTEQMVGGDTCYFEFENLRSLTQYDFALIDGAGIQVAQARLTTDRNGDIPLTALGYDLELAIGGAFAEEEPIFGVVSEYQLQVYEIGGQLVTARNFRVDTSRPMLYAADAAGIAQNSFLRGQHTVWARGVNLPPNQSIGVYVVDDVRYWQDGMQLSDVSGGGNLVSTNGAGEFHVAVWSRPNLVAPYDLVADIDNNGIYDAGRDFVDGFYPVGFMVQVLGTGADIQVQIACDADRNYNDIFDRREPVYAYLNPATQQFTHKWVHKYVVMHREFWADGDVLFDITEGFEIDTPQYGCTNEGRVLIWPAELSPGVYDIVIDTNRDGLYTRGVDFIDNIDSFGNPTGGFIVPGEGADGPEVTITSPADGLETEERVVLMQGTVDDLGITLARLIVNGAAQNIGVNNGVLDPTTVILQAGWNTIVVEVFNQYGRGHDQVDVFGVFEAVGMKVTLTWDVGPSNDVDLWVQDSTGEWCGYRNRQTAIGGWLDVDDTNGWGPENFFLPQSAMDMNPGEYNVAVNFYDDAGEGSTIPTIRVLLNEGRANQITRTIVGPPLSTEGQWWFVTTITVPEGVFGEFAGPPP